jgi:hypothetical protein
VHGALIREGQKNVPREVLARGGRAAAAKVSMEDKQRRGRLSGEARRAKTAERDQAVMAKIHALQAEGLNTFQAIADRLMADGVPAPTLGKWFASSVARLMRRMRPE